jgi:hypothetical protein
MLLHHVRNKQDPQALNKAPEKLLALVPSVMRHVGLQAAGPHWVAGSDLARRCVETLESNGTDPLGQSSANISTPTSQLLFPGVEMWERVALRQCG